MLAKMYQEELKQNGRVKEKPIVLPEKGVFGVCRCGGDIMFYSNRGVLCSRCGKLYGTWQYRRGRKKNPYRMLQNVTIAQ
jgi:hypothetical protein